jgi:hypothetical protein
MQTNVTPPLAYSLPSAAARIGIGRTKAFELAKSGAIATFTIGARRLVTDEELRRFIASQQRSEAA